jgi:hypothetical protein
LEGLFNGGAVLSKKSGIKSISCSNDNVRSSRFGPWSVEWLRNIQHGDVGLISSNKKRLKKARRDSKGRGGSQLGGKKKAGGVLRHPVITLKKVARLPSKDRAEVMKVLKNTKALKGLKNKICKRQHQKDKVTKSLEVGNQGSSNESSSASVNNDWMNWVDLQGTSAATADDMVVFGKAIGVSFQGDTQNRFSVLSRPK